MIPDRRLVRSEHPAWLKKLIAQQPEHRVREVQQFAPLLRLVADNLPPHIRPLVADLKAIIELRPVASGTDGRLAGLTIRSRQPSDTCGASRCTDYSPRLY